MATTHVNIHEAKTHLSRLINELADGDEVIIANRGRPVAKLVAAKSSKGRRKLGQLDLGGALSDATLASLVAMESDAELDEIGWPR